MRGIGFGSGWVEKGEDRRGPDKLTVVFVVLG